MSLHTSHKLRGKLLQNIEELPVLPTVLMEVMQLNPAHDDYFERLIALAEHAPLFAVRIIHLANSSAFHGRDAVLSVQGAVTRLGSRTVADILTAMSVMRVFVPRSDSVRFLWLHAIQVANMSTRFAALTHLSIDPGALYLAALLHDVGRFVMLDIAPDELGKVDEAGFDSPEALVDVEREICGLDHAKIGAKAAASWGLPDWICRAIRAHHQAPRSVDADLREAVRAIRLADDLSTWLSRPSEETEEERYAALAERAARRSELSLSAKTLQAELPELVEQSQRIMKTLGL